MQLLQRVGAEFNGGIGYFRLSPGEQTIIESLEARIREGSLAAPDTRPLLEELGLEVPESVPTLHFARREYMGIKDCHGVQLSLPIPFAETPIGYLTILTTQVRASPQHRFMTLEIPDYHPSKADGAVMAYGDLARNDRLTEDPTIVQCCKEVMGVHPIFQAEGLVLTEPLGYNILQYGIAEVHRLPLVFAIYQHARAAIARLKAAAPPTH